MNASLRGGREVRGQSGLKDLHQLRWINKERTGESVRLRYQNKEREQVMKNE